MNLYNWYYLQLVSEAHLDQGFAWAEQAVQDLAADNELIGLLTGGSITEQSPTPDLTVDAAALTATSSTGERIRVPTTQMLDVSLDYLGSSTAVASGGNTKIVSVFAYFDRSLSDPKTDGNSTTVMFQMSESYAFKVVQGAESASTPTPPALEVGKVLLADITLAYGQTQIQTVDISFARTEWAFKLSAGALTVDEGTAEASDQALLTHLNNHVTGAASKHPATAIDYAGGPAWADGTTNPATTMEAQTDKIISELSAQTGADDGGLKIGREAYSGGNIPLTIGTVASQFEELADEAGGLTLTQAWTGVNTWSAKTIYDTLDPYPIDSTAVAVVEWEMQEDGAWRIIEETSGDVLFSIDPDATATSHRTLIGTNHLELDGDITSVAPEWRYNIKTGTGANDGLAWSFRGQQGQAQTGGADNNVGGDIRFFVGKAGAGGSGAAGTPGKLVRNFDGTLVKQASEWWLTFTDATASADNIVHTFTPSTGEHNILRIVASQKATTGTQRGVVISEVLFGRNSGGVFIDDSAMPKQFWSGTGSTSISYSIDGGGTDVEVHFVNGSDIGAQWDAKFELQEMA